MPCEKLSIGDCSNPNIGAGGSALGPGREQRELLDQSVCKNCHLNSDLIRVGGKREGIITQQGGVWGFIGETGEFVPFWEKVTDSRGKPAWIFNGSNLYPIGINGMGNHWQQVYDDQKGTGYIYVNGNGTKI